MTKDEVINYLKLHLKTVKQEKGYIHKKDLLYCIEYIRGFLVMKKDAAIKFLEDNVLYMKCDEYSKCYRRKQIDSAR